MLDVIKGYIRQARIAWYDYKRDIKYSTVITGYASQEQLLSRLVVEAHTLEKGLTMPNRKQLFGKDKALLILNGCNKYVLKEYNLAESRFHYIVGILVEYCRIMKDNGITGEVEMIVDGVEKLINSIGDIPIVSQLYDVDKKDFFSQNSADFKQFSDSRHSNRYLMGHVDDDILMKALDLATNSPSTCNRQSVRLHLIQSEEAKKKLLTIQSGNRGFGNLCDQFIVLTSDLSDWPAMHQRHAPYVDGGIYLMNLLYCLHYYQIGACTLNLYLDMDRDIQLHKDLNIPLNEVPIAVVAIGIPPEHFDIALSKRRKIAEVLTRH